MRSKRSELTFRLSLSAAFLALALICKLFFSIPIPFFGAGGIRVGIGGIFTAFPAILFGPIYGGAVSALSDFLGAMIKPDGAYIPWLTLTAFAGGFVKGLLFRLILNPNLFRKLSKILALVFLIMGIIGTMVHIQLIQDDVVPDILPTKKEDVPTRDQLEGMQLSFFSDYAVNLATYNKDTYSLKKAKAIGDITVPGYLQLQNTTVSLTKIDANAFADASPNALISIPNSITKIDDQAFASRTDLTICASIDSAAHKFATSKKLPFTEATVPSETLILENGQLDGTYFTIRSSDTFRKYLSGYLNSITSGMEFVGLIGLASFAFLWIKYRKEKKEVMIGSYVQIFVSATVSGLIVTTINTFILRHFLATWNGRAFWILWVPRMAEEFIVCSIQSYFIMILYAVYRKKIKPHSSMLRQLPY